MKYNYYCTISLAMPVGCRTNSSLRCADGMCLPPSVTCDGVEYCTDGSTFDKLCGELIFAALAYDFRTTIMTLTGLVMVIYFILTT